MKTKTNNNNKYIPHNILKMNTSYLSDSETSISQTSSKKTSSSSTITIYKEKEKINNKKISKIIKPIKFYEKNEIKKINKKIFKNILQEINEIFIKIPKKVNLKQFAIKQRTKMIYNIKIFIIKYKLCKKIFFL